jgi:hypothetical protein
MPRPSGCSRITIEHLHVAAGSQHGAGVFRAGQQRHESRQGDIRHFGRHQEWGDTYTGDHYANEDCAPLAGTDPPQHEESGDDECDPARARL